MKALKIDNDLSKVKLSKVNYSALIGVGSMMVGGVAEAALVTSPSGFSQTISPVNAASGGYTLLPTLSGGAAGPNLNIQNKYGAKGGQSLSAVTLDNTTGFTTGRLTQGQIIAAGGYSTTENTIYSSLANNATDNQSYLNGLYGFSFVSNGKTNYGWINLSIQNLGRTTGIGNTGIYDTLRVTLNSYAYTTNGEFILAGAGIPAVSSVPEAESVVMLAAGLGLVGMVAKRRRQQAKSNASATDLLAA